MITQPPGMACLAAEYHYTVFSTPHLASYHLAATSLPLLALLSGREGLKVGLN